MNCLLEMVMSELDYDAMLSYFNNFGSEKSRTLGFNEFIPGWGKQQ